MKKNMKITISGTLGSGKSTVTKIVAKKLNLKYYFSGKFMRDMADERGLTLNELQKIAETNRVIDDEIDNRQKRLGELEDNFIFESRLGYYFIPDSYKIYLKANMDVAVKRILKSIRENDETRKKEGLNENEEMILASLNTRRESEKLRYKQLYNIDFEDESNYDLVIDTSNLTAEEVSDIIVQKILEKNNQ